MGSNSGLEFANVIVKQALLERIASALYNYESRENLASVSHIKNYISEITFRYLERLYDFDKKKFRPEYKNDDADAIAIVFQNYCSFVKSNHNHLWKAPEVKLPNSVLYVPIPRLQCEEIVEAELGKTSEDRDPQNLLEKAFWNHQQSIEYYYACVLALGFITKDLHNRTNEQCDELYTLHKTFGNMIDRAKYSRMQFAIMLGGRFLDRIRKEMMELNDKGMSIMQHLEPFGRLPGSYRQSDEDQFRAEIMHSLQMGTGAEPNAEGDFENTRKRKTGL